MVPVLLILKVLFIDLMSFIAKRL